MGTKERRSRHKQALRDSILSAARKLFVDQGYERVTIRQIADEIEYTPGIIYTHFASKQELFKCLCREIYMELGALAEPIAGGPGTPLERLDRGMRMYFHFGLSNRELYRLAFIIEGPPVDPADNPMQADAPAGHLFNQFSEIIEEGVRCRQIRRVDPQSAAQTIWAAVHGLTALLISDRNFPWLQPETLIDTLMETLIDGLKRRDAKHSGRHRP